MEAMDIYGSYGHLWKLWTSMEAMDIYGSRQLPCPGYCKLCCDEHWGTGVSFNSGFLSVYVWPFFKRGNGEPKKEMTKDMELLTGLAYIQLLLPTRNLCFFHSPC